MKVLITGGRGFLGQAITEALIAQGHHVTNFSRHPLNPTSTLTSWGVTSHLGDVRSKEEVRQALKGQEAVIHTASKVAMWGCWEDFYQVNVVGTKNVIQACRHHKIEKLIYTSTPSVVFGKKDLCCVDESHPYPGPKDYKGHYAHSKSLAEREVLEANGPHLATVALRPHLIFGPGDPHILPRLVKMVKENRAKRVGLGKNVVDVLYVKNAADAHVKALSKLSLRGPLSGKAYFLGQERPVVLWDFIDELLRSRKIPPIKKRISFEAAYVMGYGFEKAYRLLSLYHREPPMTRFVALQLAKSHYFSHDNAKRDFAYHPEINLEDALRRTA